MKKTTTVAKQRVLKFQVPGQKPLSIKVKNERALVSSVLPKVMRRLNIAGSCTPCDQSGQKLILAADAEMSQLPETTLLPTQLTPAL